MHEQSPPPELLSLSAFGAVIARACRKGALIALTGACMLASGCGGNAPPVEPAGSVRPPSKPHSENVTTTIARQPLVSPQRSDRSSDSVAISDKPLEDLILSFRTSSAFEAAPDTRFRSVDTNRDNFQGWDTALEENRRIMDELRRRRKSKDGLPRATLLKYRDCQTKIFTGASGPLCTIGFVCQTLLGDFDFGKPGDPDYERQKLQEF